MPQTCLVAGKQPASFSEAARLRPKNNNQAMFDFRVWHALKNPAATLDDIREAVTTLEETERTRRVFRRRASARRKDSRARICERRERISAPASDDVDGR